MTSSVLGTDTTTLQPVEIQKQSRRQGLYIIGTPGTGKSGLLENLIVQDMKQGIGVCVLDPHSELIDQVIARLPASREKDVVLLDIHDYQYPFGLNLFTCSDLSNPVEVQKPVDRVKHVFEKLLGVSQDTPLILEYLYNCTYVLVSNPGYTMADISMLLTSEKCRKKLVANVTDTEVRLFWEQYDLLKPDEQRAQAASILRRVKEFLQPLSRLIVGQSVSTMNFQDLMDTGKILLIKLDVLQLEAVSNLIGSLLIASFLNAASSRTNRNLFNIYVDEFQRFATEDFAILFSEARKFGIGLTVAHQHRDQLDKQNRAATLNVANLVVLRISGKDAEELAAEFDSTPPLPEIVGYRPILTPKQDVIDHLRKQGHVNPQVSAFVNDYLLPAVRIVEKHRKELYEIKVSPRPGIPQHKVLITDLDESINQLNAFLFQVMSERNPDIPLPPLVFFMFARLFGFSGGFAWYMAPWNVLTGSPFPSVFQPKEALLLICRPDFLAHKDQIAKKIFPNNLNITPAMDFVTSLRQLMQVLANDPILVDTGQHEPMYDKPRTYQDVQNEIATRLANLPKFTARVKIVGLDGKPVEHTVQTLPPERGFRGVALQDRIDRIQANNRHDGYVRERLKVEDEMRLRQDQCIQVAQPIPPVARRKQLVCPKCGAQYRPGAKFCNRCGGRI